MVLRPEELNQRRLQKVKLEVIEAWRVEAMLNYIKTHFTSKNLLISDGDSLREVCNNYLEFLERAKFTAYE